MKLLLKSLISLTIFLSIPSFAYAATYYVATTGSDSNPGTLSQPWKTIQYGVNKLTAGDTLYVRGGTYTGPFYLNFSGKAAAPITIAGYPGENAALINYIGVDGSYNIFENLEITNMTGVGIIIAGTNNIGRNLNVHNTWGTGVLVWGSNNIIEDSKVWQTNKNHDCAPGDTVCTSLDWGPGIAIGSSSNPDYGLNSIARNNEVYQSFGEGIDCEYTDNVQIEGNRLWDNWALGIYLDTCSYSTVNNNLVYYTSDTKFWRSGTVPGSGLALANEGIIAGHPTGHDRKIYNNITVNCGTGFNFWTGFAPNGNLNNDLIANNTFIENVNYGGGWAGMGIYIEAGHNGTNHVNTVIENNLFYASNGGKLGRSDVSAGLTFKNNLWSATPETSVVGIGDIVADPKLVNPTQTINLDQITYPLDPTAYKLTSLSPAINKAISIPEVTTDYFNNPRGSSLDIGAVEYVVSPSPTPNYLVGDINHDGVVNIQDFTLLSNAFGTSNSASDINSDGVVNVQDYILLSNNFGKSS